MLKSYQENVFALLNQYSLTTDLVFITVTDVDQRQISCLDVNLNVLITVDQSV